MTDADAALARELAALKETLRQRELLLERVMQEKGAAVLAELVLSQETVAKKNDDARRDPVTGLLRHGFGRIRLDFELTRSRSVGGPLSAALVDLDQFHVVNERAGYEEGERALAVIARGVQTVWKSRALPRPPVAAREGGNRFLGLFPGADRARAEECAEEARAFVERLPLPVRITATVSFCEVDGGATGASVMERLVRALVEGKRAGGNRVSAA